MRVLFVYPNATSTEYISYGIAYLSANLKAHGHETGLLDLTWNGSVRRTPIRQAIDAFAPDLVAFSATSVDYPLALKVARAVKAQRDLPVLFGGVHATVAPEVAIAEDVVDMVCVGEGEEALADLCDRWDAGRDITDTPNFWFKSNGRVIRNALRPLIQDLDRLPFQDRDLFDLDRRSTVLNGKLGVQATRGCPHGCTYCANYRLRRLYKGQKYLRSRSVGNVLREIEECMDRYHVRSIDFMDDVFIANRQWVLEFCEAYAAHVRLPFRCGGRVEYVTDEVCRVLAQAGCTWLFLGIEAGNPTIRRDVMHRRYSNEQVVEAFRIARVHGLNVASFNMIGLPHETRETLWQTVQLNKAVQPDDLRASILQPYHGTEIRRWCIAAGLIDEDTLPGDFLECVIRHPNLTAQTIETFRRRFAFHVYWPEQPLKALIFYLAGFAHARYARLRRYLPLPLMRFVNQVFNR
jgi:anaerobic magnesium-protoporphyrin IX monomethyl ester cyclase